MTGLLSLAADGDIAADKGFLSLADGDIAADTGRLSLVAYGYTV